MYMSNSEICRRYKEMGADDKAIKVLAELNGVKKYEIIEVIKGQGSSSNTKTTVEVKIKKQVPVEKHEVKNDVSSFIGKKKGSESSIKKTEKFKWTDEIKEKIKRGILDGLSYEEIADINHLNKNNTTGKQVYYKIRKDLIESGIEIKKPNRGRKVEDTAKIKAENEFARKVLDDEKVVEEKKESEKEVVEKKTESENNVGINEHSSKIYSIHSNDLEHNINTILRSINKIEESINDKRRHIKDLQVQINSELIDIKNLEYERVDLKLLLKTLKKVEEGINNG